MSPATSSPSRLVRALPFWAVWFAMFNGLLILRVIIGFPAGAAERPQTLDAISLVCLGALALSVAARWWVLPRATTPAVRLPVFMVGCALAEGSGILALMLAPGRHQELFVLGLLGLLQMAPLFTLRDEPPPAAFR